MATSPAGFRKVGEQIEVDLESTDDGRRWTESVGGVFLFVGMLPNVDLAKDRLDLEDDGTVKVDEWKRTNVPHVYAVGDLARKPVRQITLAVADGTVAGIHAARMVASEE